MRKTDGGFAQDELDEGPATSFLAEGRPPGFDAEADKQRNTVERRVNRLKQWRRRAMRTDRLAIAYQSAPQPPAIPIWTRRQLAGSTIHHPVRVGRPRALADDVVDDPERFLKRNGVLVQVCVVLPVGEKEAGARSLSSGVDSMLAGIAFTLHQHHHRPLGVGHESQPAARRTGQPRVKLACGDLARSVSSTTSDDSTVLLSSITQASVMSSTIS